jgi:hypothetical protein
MCVCVCFLSLFCFGMGDRSRCLVVLDGDDGEGDDVTFG